MVLAALWAPQIKKFSTLFEYLQQVLAYAVGPIIAVFLMGLFTHRIHSHAAWIALLIATFSSVILFFVIVVYKLFDLHFLYVIPSLLVETFLVSVIANFFYPKPANIDHELRWSNSYYGKYEVDEIDKNSYNKFKALALGLLLLTLIQVIWYW